MHSARWPKVMHCKKYSEAMHDDPPVAEYALHNRGMGHWTFLPAN